MQADVFPCVLSYRIMFAAEALSCPRFHYRFRFHFRLCFGDAVLSPLLLLLPYPLPLPLPLPLALPL